MRKLIIGVAAVAVTLILTASSCGDDGSPQASESQTQQRNYEYLTGAQPALEAEYSPTRATINFWIETWGQAPGKLSYVYFLASNGQMVGYYIFEGLPVNYCASLTPTYRWEDQPGDGSNAKQQVPAPAMDGVFYSGGQCNTFYGKDAVSGSYIEYTPGAGLTPLLYDQPLPRQDVEPLGVATIENVDD